MTNPDNAGGLPDHLIACAGALGGTLLLQGGIRLTSDHLRQAAELCRAATAGGADTLRAAAKRLRLGVEGPRLADELEAMADSAPAGSGEELAKWVEGARDYATGGNVRPDDGDEDQEQWDRLTEAAALLRKLQQGAAPEELSGNGVKVESGFTGSGDGPVTPTVLISFAAGDFFSRDRFMRMIVAASQGQEGGHE